MNLVDYLSDADATGAGLVAALAATLGAAAGLAAPFPFVPSDSWEAAELCLCP
jgi:hypothetical protein